MRYSRVEYSLDPETRHRMVTESHELLAHIVPILSSCHVHGNLIRVEPHRVLLRTDALPAQLFNAKGFIRPTDRWRLIYPANNGKPPVVIRIEGQFRQYNTKKWFEIKQLDARWVTPPSNSVNEKKPTINPNVRYF